MSEIKAKVDKSSLSCDAMLRNDNGAKWTIHMMLRRTSY